jgi:hypothetical protein
MKADTSPDTLAVPPALLAEIQADADKEHLPAGDVLREVIERGLEQRRWHRVLAYGADRAKALGLTEDDVSRLIAESRREQRQGRE